MEEFFDSSEKDKREMMMMRMPLWRKLVEKDWDLLQSNLAFFPPWEKGLECKKLQDELVESGPALIAVKGFPCTGKSSRASVIASFLRCAHLDLDDIRNCTQQTHQHLLLSTDPEVAASANSHLDELSHRALLQFTSAQLLLGHDVVVNSPLSCPELIHQLIDLADSISVPLIVIECMVLDNSKSCLCLMQKNSNSMNSSSAFSSRLEVNHILEDRLWSFDSDINDFPRLVIYKTQDCHYECEPETARVLNIVNQLGFILLYKQNLGSKCNATASPSNESGRDGEKLKRHFSHSHPLTFVSERDNHKDSAAAAAPDCRICSLPITESSYDCSQCNFSAHWSCIELPQCTSFSPHIHPLSLYVQSYKFIELEEDIMCTISSIEPEEAMKCIVCNGANRGPIYRCWQCYGLFVHHKCTQLSHELKHPCHEHPLKLETYNLFPWGNEFTCCACGHEGGNIWYGCSTCKLKLHLSCALELPLEIDYKCAQFHPLVLAPPPKNDYGEHYCDVCEEKRHCDYWIYYCRSCEFHAHLNCVNPKIEAYDMSDEEGLQNDGGDGDVDLDSFNGGDRHGDIDGGFDCGGGDNNNIDRGIDGNSDGAGGGRGNHNDMDYGIDGNRDGGCSSGGSASSGDDTIYALCASQRASYHGSKDNLVGMVIAMKGGPCTGKTTLTRALAKSLRCTLVSHDDFLSCTSDTERLLSTCPSIDTLPAKHLNNLSYEVLWTVAETQLHRHHNVIIDSSFHTRAHMDRLLSLSSSGKKNVDIMLIIIECRALDKSEWSHRLSKTYGPRDTERIPKEEDSYDTGDIPKLIIDTTSQNGIEDHVTNIEMFIMSCLDKKLYGQIGKLVTGCPCEDCREPDDCRETSHLPTTLKHQCHKHELTLENSGPFDAFVVGFPVCCYGCGGQLAGVCYSCSVYSCYFKLHVKCAFNLPLTITFPSHHWHPPLVLTSHPLDPELCYCDFCEEKRDPRIWIYSCQECEYYVHVSCAIPEFYEIPDSVGLNIK